MILSLEVGRTMAEIEIGLGKSGRRSYGLDELRLLPDRRTRDIDSIDLSCQIDAYRLDLPFLASAMDSVTVIHMIWPIDPQRTSPFDLISSRIRRARLLGIANPMPW